MRRELLPIGLVLAALTAFYGWTVAPGGSPIRAPARYNQLADAFQHGQLALLQRPSPAFRSLPDPYDPKANASFVRDESLLDLSYYKGKLYFSSWGPTPALLLYLPARWLPGSPRVSDTFADMLFCTIGLVASSLLLVLLARRLVPDAPRWTVALGVAVLGLGSVAPFVLRNPGVYQVAQAGGFAFGALGALAIAAGALGGRVRTWALAAGSTSLGLAAGSRFTYALAVLLPLAALAWLWRRRQASPARAVALLAPLGACIVALLVYNDLRYGSFTEFGLHHLLNSARPKDQENPANVAPNAWAYLLAPLLGRGDFPFLHIGTPANYPGTLPAHYWPEYTGGLLPTQPLLLGLLAAPLLRRLRVARPARWTIAVLALLGAAMLLTDAYGAPASTQRYELDMAPWLLTATLLCWMALATRLRRPGARAATLALGAGLGAFGALAGIALSIIGQSDRALPTAHPETFAALARAFRWLSPLAGSLSFGTVTGQAAVGVALLAGLAAVCAATWRWGGRAAAAGPAVALFGLGLLVVSLLARVPGIDSGQNRLTALQAAGVAVGAACMAAGGTLTVLRRPAAGLTPSLARPPSASAAR